MRTLYIIEEFLKTLIPHTCDDGVLMNWSFELLVGLRTFGRHIARGYRVDSKYNMTCSLQVIGTGSSEIGPCLSLFTESGRFLFNCPESFQTAVMENSMKLKSFKHAFITRPSWSNVGGLPGLALSSKDLDDDNRSHWTVTGPGGLDSFPDICKVFLDARKTGVGFTPATDALGEAAVYKNNSFTITAIELSPSDAPLELSDYSEGSDDDEKEEQPSKRACLQRTGRISSVVAYVCKLATIRGKFDAKKAAQLGLPPGPQYATLTKGIPVTAPSGNVIHPHQVLGSDQIGPQFLVIEIPSSSFLPSLISHSSLLPPELNPVIIVHITPKEVYQEKEYQDWLKGFGKGTKHILLHRDFCPPEMSLRSCFNVQLPLHMIDSNVFRLPTFVSLPNDNSAIANDPSVIIGQNDLVFHLRPSAKLGKVDCDDTLKTMNSIIHETMTRLSSNSDFNHQLEQNYSLKDNFNALLTKSSPSSSYLFTPSPLPEGKSTHITFLGTGSTFPSKYRNVSSILLHLPNGGYVLLDAGEGTLSQLYKCFGPVVADGIMLDLRCVFVSHIHGDHSLGLVNVLRKRKELQGQATFVIGPSVLYNWLKKYSRFIEKLDFKFANASKFDGTKQSYLPEPLKCFKLLHTVPVIHIPQSYGIVLNHKDGWKMVYSGDTRPCPDLIEAGKDATLLIHEATFNHSLLDDAIAKRHSTDVEALKVSTDMNASFLMLTHFSQRYSKYSTALVDISSPNMSIAFDLMTIQIDNLKHIQTLTPVIKKNLSVLF